MGRVPGAARRHRRVAEHDARGSLRVGIDCVLIAEVADSLARFGDRYVRHTFTEDEAAYCLAAPGHARAARLAARFAAKEAAVKVLDPDRPWADWRAIEVRRRPSGSCALVFHGAAAALARRRGLSDLALSMTHDAERAAAIVLASAER